MTLNRIWLGLVLLGSMAFGQVSLEGLKKLTRDQAKAQGRTLTLDGSIPVQDHEGRPVAPTALMGKLQGGYTLDLYVDDKGDLKVMVLREKTEAERQKGPKLGDPLLRPNTPLPEPTAEDLAAVDCGQVKQMLEDLLEDDQGHRKAPVQEPGKPVDALKMVSNLDQGRDQRNQRRLMAIVQKCGWPTKAKAGEKGMIGAFLVLQHAPLSLQERWQPLVRGSVEAGDLPQSMGALLEDRILMYKGKPQVYGTQSTFFQGKGYIWPIADPDQVDARRRLVGLPPLAQDTSLKSLGLSYPKDVYPLK